MCNLGNGIFLYYFCRFIHFELITAIINVNINIDSLFVLCLLHPKNTQFNSRTHHWYINKIAIPNKVQHE